MGDLNDQTQDVSLHDDTTNAAVTTTSDGGKVRLDVQTQDIVVTPPVYRYQQQWSDTDIDFTDATWHTIVDITDDGKPYSFQAEFYTSNFDIRVTIDGEIVFEMNNSEMGQANLNQQNAFRFVGGMPYRYSSDAIVWHFRESEAFETSFKIEVARRSGTSSGLDNYIFAWGKKI